MVLRIAIVEERVRILKQLHIGRKVIFQTFSACYLLACFHCPYFACAKLVLIFHFLSFLLLQLVVCIQKKWYSGFGSTCSFDRASTMCTRTLRFTTISLNIQPEQLLLMKDEVNMFVMRHFFIPKIY